MFDFYMDASTTVSEGAIPGNALKFFWVILFK